MKVILSWITDPCVHLILIGLLLMRLLMGLNPDNDPDALADHLAKCPVCGTLHEAGTTCPLLVVKQAALPVRN